MAALSEHAVFLFLVQFAVLLAAARLLGALAQRLKQPSVMGELIAGVLLGPAVFGKLLPSFHAALFPRVAIQEQLLEMLSWLSMILLILRTGLDVDLTLWRRLGRAALFTTIFGIAIPYGAGFIAGHAVPKALLGGDRTVFALFLATAMSISAVKVVARTLLDLKLTRRDIGAVILAAAVADDTIGWVLLSVISSIAMSGSLSVGHVLQPIGATVLVLLLAALPGRAFVRRVIGRIERNQQLEHAAISAIVIFTLAAGAITQRLGLHAVFGAFIAGVLVARSPRVRQATLDSLGGVILGVFAPLFFAYTGLRVTTLALPPWPITLSILGIAIAGKVLGAGFGARLGGMRLGAALAVGIGMASRGSMELVIARIGLDLHVLTPSVYAAIVLIPLVTSVIVPPLLKLATRAIRPEPEESARLDQEEESRRAIIKREGTKILAAVSGGPRSLQAMHLAAPLALQPGATLVALSVVAKEPGRRWHRREGLSEEETRAALAAFAHDHPLPDFHERVVSSLSPVAEVERELERGYDLVFIGAGRRRTVSNRMLSAVLESRRANAVLMSGETFARDFKRILIATDGSFAARGAAELALLYAKEQQAEVQVVHVAPSLPEEHARSIAGRIVADIVELGERHGVRVTPRITRSVFAARAIIEAARELRADLVVLGAEPQLLGRRTFLGNTVESVLRSAPCAVALFVRAAPRAESSAA